MYQPNQSATLPSMTAQQTAPAGWYPNQYGQMQWWDGTHWGAVHTIPTSQLKKPGTAYLLAILLGGFAAHRFYLRTTALAIIWNVLWWGGWLLSFVGVGFIMLGAAFIWWVVDLFLIPALTRKANGL